MGAPSGFSGITDLVGAIPAVAMLLDQRVEFLVLVQGYGAQLFEGNLLGGNVTAINRQITGLAPVLNYAPVRAQAARSAARAEIDADAALDSADWFNP